ncbi:MAG: ParB/RepB/Spo0J family partition protein, partial [Odoribacter sp.]|nr:ParB/RepB/Spo0J family partition protein [Odoribacter sp.]
MAKKNVLGRGLGALITDVDDEPVTREVVVSAMQELNLADIRPNPFQPRTEFDEEALNELAASIRSIGIVQPITVRAVEDGKYEIVAGERRYRASKLAGRTTIPAYIRKTEDESLLELALIENIQREDLNAIEVAISYQRLIDECQLTQDGLSERVGKK